MVFDLSLLVVFISSVGLSYLLMLAFLNVKLSTVRLLEEKQVDVKSLTTQIVDIQSNLTKVATAQQDVLEEFNSIKLRIGLLKPGSQEDPSQWMTRGLLDDEDFIN